MADNVPAAMTEGHHRFQPDTSDGLTNIERVRMALAISDAGYSWELDQEYAEDLLAAYDAQTNEIAALKSQVEEQDRLLAEAADFLNRASRLDAMDLGAVITAYRLKQQRSVAMPLEDQK